MNNNPLDELKSSVPDPTRFVERSFTCVENPGQNLVLIDRTDIKQRIRISWSDLNALAELIAICLGTVPLPKQARDKVWEDAIKIAKLHAGSCPGDTQFRMIAALEAARDVTSGGHLVVSTESLSQPQPQPESASASASAPAVADPPDWNEAIEIAAQIADKHGDYQSRRNEFAKVVCCTHIAAEIRSLKRPTKESD